MIELIVGAAVGAGSMLIKDKVTESQFSNEISNLKRELNKLSDDNEKLRSRNKEAERQIDDLNCENQKLRKTSKTADEDCDDLQENLDNAKNKIKKLNQQNEELIQKISEYKIACQNYENEIFEIKNK